MRAGGAGLEGREPLALTVLRVGFPRFNTRTDGYASLGDGGVGRFGREDGAVG